MLTRKGLYRGLVGSAGLDCLRSCFLACFLVFLCCLLIEFSCVLLCLLPSIASPVIFCALCLHVAVSSFRLCHGLLFISFNGVFWLGSCSFSWVHPIHVRLLCACVCFCCFFLCVYVLLHCYVSIIVVDCVCMPFCLCVRSFSHSNDLCFCVFCCLCMSDVLCPCACAILCVCI